MHRKILLAYGAALTGLLAMSATPAAAQGKKTRAEAAVAAARAKVETANALGALGEVPHLQSQARAMLHQAEEDLAGDHKEQAIADANHASEMADRAIGESERVKRMQAQAGRADAMNAASAAQNDAAAANARAEAAERAAADAARQAEMARNQPPQPVIVQTPPPERAEPTTVEVERTATVSRAPATSTRRVTTRRVVHHRTVRRPARRTVTERTTITTNPER